MLEPILLIDDFSANQISEIRDFLHSHQEVFDNSKQTQTAVAPYRTANKHNEIIKEEVDKILAKGIISPSKSAWSARFEKDSYPLPHITETLEYLSNNKYFSLKEEDKCKTAFITKHGLFEFNVMPFGLTNAPATFQRTMDIVLSGLTWRNCMVYIDDVIVYSPTYEQHLADLDEVLNTINQARLKLKLSWTYHFRKWY